MICERTTLLGVRTGIVTPARLKLPMEWVTKPKWSPLKSLPITGPRMVMLAILAVATVAAAHEAAHADARDRVGGDDATGTVSEAAIDVVPDLHRADAAAEDAERGDAPAPVKCRRCRGRWWRSCRRFCCPR